MKDLMRESNRYENTMGFGAAPLTAADVRLLETVGEEIHLRPGDVLFEEGVRSRHIYLIQRGEVEVGHRQPGQGWMDMGPFGWVDLDDSDREFVAKRTLRAGECIGEDVCARSVPHSCCAIARTAVDVLEVDMALLEGALYRHPQLRTHLAQALFA